MLQKAYSEWTLSKIRSYEWSSSPIEVKIAKVKEIVTENRHLSSREISAELSVSRELIRTILNDFLGMKRVAVRLVPKDLNFLQKLNHLIWLQPTFFSFQNSNYHSEAPVSVYKRHKREFATRTEIDSGKGV